MSPSSDAIPSGTPRVDPLGSALAHHAFESAAEGLLVLDADGVVLAVNRAFCDLYGIDAAETVGSRHAAFTDRLQVTRLGEPVGPEGWVTARALRGERVKGVLQALRNLRNGREFVARCGAVPLFEEGRLVATTVTVEDVTSWKEAEDARQAQDARDRAVLAAERAVTDADGDEATLMRVAVDEARRLTGAEGACLEIQEGDEMVYVAAGGIAEPFVGLRLPAAGSLSGLTVREGVSTRSDDAETDDRVDREACRRVGVRSMALVPLRYDERGFGVLKVMSGRPSAFGEGESQALDLLGGFLGAAVGRARAAGALARSGEAFERLVRNSPLGLYAVDADFRLALVSQGAQKVFENVRPLVGRDFAEVLRVVWEEPFASEAIRLFRHTLATGEPYHAPSTVERRGDIEEIESYDWKIERIGMPDGRLGVVCSFYDLSSRLRVEDALRQSEERQRVTLAALADAKARTDAILASADVATWLLDVQNDRLYADRNLARFFDLDEADANGGPAAAYLAKIHPDDQERVARELGEAIAAGTPYDVDYRIVARGEERWVTARGLPERDEEGRVLRLPGVVVDVTQLKRAQERARESEAQYRLLVESVPEIAWTARPDGHLDYYNERWYEYTGQKRGEGGDTSWTPTLHPDDLEPTYEAFRRSITTGEPYEVELRLREGATGGYRWFLARARPMRDAGGGIVRWFGVTSDIDEQKRTQQALAIASRLGSALTQELDPDRVIQALSDASTEAVGAEFGSFFYARPEVEPGPEGGERFGLYVLSGAPREAFASFPPVRVTPLFSPTFLGQGVVRSDDVAEDPRYRGMPMGHLPVRSYLAVPVRGRDGLVLGGLLFGHSEPSRFTEEHERLVAAFAAQASVAYENAVLYERLREAKEGLERRVAERTEELTRANRDLNEFSYSVAHDLRAPLRAIVSTSRILLDDLGERLEPAEREALERQATNATRLAKIVDDLLGFARLANAELRRRDLDVTAIARRVADEVRARREGPCEIRVQEGMIAKGDPSLVGYALTNLVDNACKFTRGEGAVTVGEEDGAFFVRDEGVGFDMAHAHKLFVAFERLVGQDEFEGTGVGLANVKRIVERHDGRVWAESEPGRGATFWFTLG